MQMRWLVLQLPSWTKGVREAAIYQGRPSRDRSLMTTHRPCQPGGPTPGLLGEKYKPSIKPLLTPVSTTAVKCRF